MATSGIRHVAVSLLLLPLLAGATPARKAPEGELHGTLQLLQEGKPARDGVEQAVVYFTPQKAPKLELPAQPPEMATVKKEFKPHALVVPVGGSVRFPNQDPILHNAFSVSPGNAFDVGVYAHGPGKDVAFQKAGLVRVFCNVHQSMAAYVLVLDTPYWTSPDAAGNFTLGGLPTGPGTLSIWHERGELTTQQVTVAATPGAPLQLSLKVSKARVPLHLNKFGKPYSTGGAY